MAGRSEKLLSVASTSRQNERDVENEISVQKQ
jgi:hypothetical protein